MNNDEFNKRIDRLNNMCQTKAGLVIFTNEEVDMIIATEKFCQNAHMNGEDMQVANCFWKRVNNIQSM